MGISARRIMVIGRISRRSYLLGGLGIGAVAALGQAPVGAWPVSLVALALLFGLWRAAPTWRRAALLGWAAGTGYFALALSWIVEPFLVDAARDAWMAPFALIFMATGLALFWAAGLALARLCGGSALAFVAALTLTEAARGRLMTGFPWAQPGHIWIGTPVMQWASVIGALGLCVVTFALACGIWALAAHRWRSAAAALALAPALWITGTMLNPVISAAPDAATIRLVQPNAPQHQKWDPAMIPIFFQRQMDFTSAAPQPDLVVWPETAIPVLLNNAQPTLREIRRAAGGAPVILGAQRVDQGRRYNSLALIGNLGQIDALYDKQHLVPFGEYIPYGRFFKRLGLQGLAAEDGDGFSAGPGPQVIDIPGIGTATPLICYEGVFPWDVAAAPERPDVLLLITNDAWFGRFSGPYQHFAQARLRSIEQGLPMIRVGNTGISAMIDARGAVLASLHLGEAGYLDVPLPPPNAPTLYSRTGDAPILALIVLVLTLGALSVTARRRKSVSN